MTAERADPGLAEKLTVAEVASLGDVVIVAKRLGVLGFIDGESCEVSVTYWYEKNGPPNVIRTAQFTIRRHPKGAS